VQIRISGLTGAVDLLTAAQRRLGDLSPVLAVIAADTRTLIDDAFSGSHTPEGTPWAPLKPSTIASRRGGSSMPLIDTSTLRSSISTTVDRSRLRFGTNVRYAAAQQLGFAKSGTLKRRSRGRKVGAEYTVTVEARPFLPVRRAGGSFRLMTVGLAGQHWRASVEMIKRYIATGEVT